MYWDVFIAILLLFVCFTVPLRLALNLDVITDANGTVIDDSDDLLTGWEKVMYLTDVFFFIDLVMCFFTTIEDRERMTEVTDIKAICKNYLSGWFSIDFVSILPLDRIVNLFLEAQSNGNNKANSIIRVLKIGKIYKLIRLIRIIKLLKLMKTK
jgi:hypothetical protein